MKRGLFVTFEGGEGAGKSTAIAAAGEALARHGIAYRLTREPGGTPLGEALRTLVLDAARTGTCREAEVLMMFAARAQHVVETIEPALAAGQWVLSDRFADGGPENGIERRGGLTMPATLLDFTGPEPREIAIAKPGMAPPANAPAADAGTQPAAPSPPPSTSPSPQGVAS